MRSVKRINRPGAGRPSNATLRLRRIEAMFPIARQIVEAAGHRQRAAILLRIPDAVLLHKLEDLRTACDEAGFAAGVQFLVVRTAGLTATRDAAGALPAASANQLDLWRQGFAALANGG